MESSTAQNTDLFFNAAFSIDLALFTYREGKVQVLLQKKEESESYGQLGLMGQLIHPSMDTVECLKDMGEVAIGTRDFYFKQLRAFTELGRHPEGRVVTVAYYGLVSEENVTLHSDRLKWYDIHKTPKLTFDHDQILAVAKHRFKKGLLRHPTVFKMIPDEFILREVLDIYEQVFQEKLDAPNFRRQIRDSGLLIPAGELRSSKGQMGRRPQVFRFDWKKYSNRKKQMKIGFHPVA